jgi:large subunit ribosomal protein L16
MYVTWKLSISIDQTKRNTNFLLSRASRLNRRGLLRKYLLVTEFHVSKCGSHIVKTRRVMLYPKRTKYSNYFKCRCSRGHESDDTQLGFGRYGTKSCRAARLSYRAIEAVRRATIGQFHRAMSWQLRRKCKIWVRVLANLPITGKPAQV